MLQPNPRSNCFNFRLPNEFFIDAVCEKYNNMITMLNGTFTSIQDIINESIIGVDLPGFAFTPTQSQTQANGLNEYILTRPNQTLYEILNNKEFTITFRFGDGYLNYYCLLEHFMHKFLSKRDFNGFDKNGVKDNLGIYVDMPVTLLMMNGFPLFTCIFKKCLFNGIDPVNLSHNQQARDFKEFKIYFQFTGIDCSINTPELRGNVVK